jgi:hypothetical protein
MVIDLRRRMIAGEKQLRGTDLFFLNRRFSILSQGTNYFIGVCILPPYFQRHLLKLSRPFLTGVHLILATH